MQSSGRVARLLSDAHIGAVARANASELVPVEPCHRGADNLAPAALKRGPVRVVPPHWTSTHPTSTKDLPNP